MGMLMQVPYSVFVAKFLSGNYGNIAVWISLILGQPVAILMYYHDYFVMHYKGKSPESVFPFAKGGGMRAYIRESQRHQTAQKQ